MMTPFGAGEGRSSYVYPSLKEPIWKAKDGFQKRSIPEFLNPLRIIHFGNYGKWRSVGQYCLIALKRV